MTRTEAPGFTARAVLRLSFIEVWERYSFFTLFALLPLFVAAPIADGGLGWSPGDALRFFGSYLLAVQMAPLVGGYVADRWLGSEIALVLGGIALLLGHAAMAAVTLLVDGSGTPPLFYGSVALVALGNGFFKPVLTGVVGRLPYAEEAERTAAFTTFFLYLNVGGLASLLLGGWLAQTFGWVWAFAASTAGMVAAVAAMRVLGPTYIRPFVGAPGQAMPVAATGAPSAFADWRVGVGLLLSVFVLVTTFSYQSYGFVNLFTETLVDRDVRGFRVPTTWFAALNPITIMVLSPLLVVLWRRGRAGHDWSTIARVAASLLMLALAFAMLSIAAVQARGELAHPAWVVGAIVLIAAGELLFAPAINAGVTRLLPPHRLNVGMGMLTAAAGIGAWASGRIGAVAMEGERAATLGIVAAAALCSALALALLRRRIGRLGV